MQSTKKSSKSATEHLRAVTTQQHLSLDRERVCVCERVCLLVKLLGSGTVNLLEILAGLEERLLVLDLRQPT